ncbi:hypothetical protein BofuT4_P073720.1 [Botrytis cinerea T4]|uniref:Uncharacterized protein n=1 Tax=Botryotinia fuckeliana (strain T4) TaxID=999810 RepID=G2XPF4_BOTF4|nr:hypothetical protein BofuT4_P073720.1 [Botrytis cinerea T4]
MWELGEDDDDALILVDAKSVSQEVRNKRIIFEISLTLRDHADIDQRDTTTLFIPLNIIQEIGIFPLGFIIQHAGLSPRLFSLFPIEPDEYDGPSEQDSHLSLCQISSSSVRLMLIYAVDEAGQRRSASFRLVPEPQSRPV